MWKLRLHLNTLFAVFDNAAAFRPKKVAHVTSTIHLSQVIIFIRVNFGIGDL